MGLPKRLYYPLAQAAIELKCTVKDLIHFGAIGEVEICTLIDFFRLKYICDPDEEKPEIYSQGKYFYFDCFSWLPDWKGMILEGCGGLLHVNKATLLKLDLGQVHPTRDRALLHFPKCNFPSPMYTNGGMISDEIDFDYFTEDKFYITEDEMRKIKSTNFEIHSISILSEPLLYHSSTLKKPLSKKTENAKSKLIKALIEIQYGRGSSDTVRSLLNEERSTGDMLADFDLMGIKPPVTGRTLADWLKDIELDYVENPTSGLEDSTKS